MTQAYWIAPVTVTDSEACTTYENPAPAAFEAFGARFMALSSEGITLEGGDWQRHVTIEFADRATALACYPLNAYQWAKSH